MYCPACQANYPPDWKACPKDATSLLKSAQIGKYRVEGLLGVGGMGAVYRAANPDIRGSRVAIKVMNPAVAGAEATRERFKREAAAVAALRTSHVVKVYDFDADADGSLYLVMELLDGHALRDEIAPGPQQMDLARVQMVMDGALRGLAAAHRAGIVHRDLKPENIFIAETDDGEVPKLLDFGIARVKSTDQNLTHTGSLMGTASYMAIEQIAANAGSIGSWTDVYAMGAILYEMLAGAPAFGGNTITEVLQRVLQAELVPLATVRTGLPSEVYALVTRCMSPDITERPQDAEAMRRALIAAELVKPGTTVPPRYETRPDPRPARGDAAIAPTEGRDTPIPAALTPPQGIELRRSEPGAAPVARKRAVWPFALGGVAVVGIGGLVLAKVLGGASGAEAPRDAAAPAIVEVVVDASVALDTPPPAPETHAQMVRFAGGDHEIGVARARGDWLPSTRVSVEAFWIDEHEVTRAELEAALGDQLPAAARSLLEKDAPGTPARHVTWADASAACAAVGKRLPTEAEWEIAARTTPGDPKRARLLRKNGDADLAAPSTDCSADKLCDMLGGLSEWTADDITGRPGIKVVRGASYRDRPGGKLDTIHQRQAVPAGDHDNTIGFRCAISAKGP